MVNINRNEDQHLHQKFLNGGISFQNPSQDNTNKRKSFEIFLKERYSDVAAKYTFLSSQQIKKRILDMWKKMSPNSNNPRKVEETPKRNKRQFTKNGNSFNNNHPTGEPKKSKRQPLKSKALVPLKVDVVPAPLKGVLKSDKIKAVGNKRVSFDCDPEIRYRTASETSSTSTLKSIQSLKEIEDNGLHFNPQTVKKRYSSEMLMAANKSEKPKSKTEKKFDDLLNDKCSWTYKSIKTIKCQKSGQNNENGPILKIRTVNIEETAYNRDSRKKNAVCPVDEYDYMEADTEKKAKKNVKLPRKSRNSKTTQPDSTKGNRNICQPKETLDESMQMNTISKRNKRNLTGVSYAESDSSSDDGLVFLSRRYEEGMVNGTNSDTNEIPQENSSNIRADESNYNVSDSNNFEISQANFAENYTEMDNFKAYDNQTFKSQSYDEIKATENNSDQEKSETHFQDQDTVLDLLFNDDYQNSNSSRNSTENQIPEKEIDLSASETLSSLSEGNSSKFEERKEKDKRTKRERFDDAKSKNDQNSEIIQQFVTVSTEVQAVCNDLEAPNDDEEDEIVNDFFSGNFNLEKYKSKIDTDKTASIRTERNENSSYKSELLNKTKPDDSPKTYSDRGIRSSKELRKHTTKHSDNARDTKKNSKEFGNKINFKNTNTSTSRKSTRVKEQPILYFDGDSTSSEQNNEDEAENDLFGGNEYSLIHSVIDSPKTYSDSGIRSNEKIRKRTNRNSDNAKDTKQKCKEMNSKNKNASNVRNPSKVKEQYNLYFDGDNTSSEQRNEDEEGNDILGGNEYSLIHSIIDSPKTYSDSGIRSNKIRKYIDKNSDNAKDTKGKRKESDNKINSKNKNTANVRCSKRVKDQHTLYFDSDRTSSEQSNEDEAGNDALEGNEYSAMDDYFKENSSNVHKKNRKLNKIVQKRDDSEKSKSDAKLEQNVKNTNTHQLLDKRDTKLTFPKKYDVAQQSATPKTENIPLDNVKDGRSAKCTKKKAPKTWEDLEADILNREEQISFFPLLETETFPIGEAFLKDEKLSHTGTNKNSSHRPDDNFEIANTKTQDKWAIAKSEQGNSGQLVSGRNVNNDVTFDSPNASIIDRVIRRMQLCTSPVLTPYKVMPQMEEHQKSPILTEYSYSVQETKSVVFRTENKLNEKQTRQSKTTYKGHAEKNVMQKNYRFCKKREIKTVINPNGASITNQTSVKLNEIPKKKNIKLSKSSESDDDSLPESNENSEMKNSTPESDKSLSFPQNVLASSVNGSYNLRKRKCKDNTYRQRTTKKRSILKVNNVTKSNSINKYKGNKTNKHDKQNILPLIEKPMREEASTENFTLINKRKRGNKSNFMNSSANNVDESEPEDLFQNGASSIDNISDRQDRYLEKSNSNVKLPKISNEGMSSQTNALLLSENAKAPVQSLQKQVYNAKKSMKTEKPRRDSKEEYEKYLQTLFSKDITEDFNVQWEFLDGTNETSENNLQKKDDKSYSSEKKLLTENSDEELFSLSSGTESEVEKPSPRRASGLLDDVFN
ncbi:hypothetical protein AVEN_46951-1 [Araneus ventricosus]|uniref:Uncharacterized protein n=1 Tax=Araneus ventricosus TaxID=182803 RepID=A0A4Y2FKL4_ARAVE|nr:hypothetical protein AVEN_46951-1 [Araneus ventricosus]